MADILDKRSSLTVVTPMMQQYLDIKAEYEDYILMYRLGDFFECFFEDAITASNALGLTLTGRDCGGGKRAAMCGVPFHKADMYIGELVEKGYKVAICEQTEDPTLAEGLVKREVIRVVTPGTITDGSLLNDQNHNYLAALCFAGSGVGVGFADVSTGQVLATYMMGEELAARLQNELATYSPKEVLWNLPSAHSPALARFLTDTCHAISTDDRADLFDLPVAKRLAEECFGASSAALTEEATLGAVGALLCYIRETQMCDPSFVRDLCVYRDGQYMELDHNTRRNLELVESMRTKEKKGSLLWVLDKTETAMGARLLRDWVTKPLLSVAQITRRQEAIAALADDFMQRQELRHALSGILDLERLTARVAYGTAGARDLRALCQSMMPLPALKQTLASCKSARLAEMAEQLDTLDDLCSLIDRALVDSPPATVREGGMIRDGYHEDVDYLRHVRGSGEDWMHEIEEREREATGIKTLRVGYNKVFGYFIEVTKSLISQVPDRYIRKQTLTGAERYITQELKEMEATVLGAADKLCALEFSLFTSLREEVASAASRIQKTAALVAETDVFVSLSDVAVDRHYVCPTVDNSGIIDIEQGRHPVVELFVKESYFVPNDTKLNTADERLMLITGPNMAGKSTYMRQVALIALLAQIGSFVPATKARVGVIDKLFTRVGASDDLASGQSTFMLEMAEVSHILKNATSRSLIIYDEVGRGTSTFDGMSIARAVAEYTLGKKIGAKTLFATHYHELTVLETEVEGVVNYHIAAKKKADGIVFLRKIVRGATDDSYGIEVAKLAGLPKEVTTRARAILSAIEEGKEAAPTPKLAPPTKNDREPDMLSLLSEGEEKQVADKLRALDLNTLTPIEAMNLLYECKKMLTV